MVSARKRVPQISYKERQYIEKRLKDGAIGTIIADELGRYASSIYKEIKRGTFENEYCSEYAQRVSEKNLKRRGRKLTLPNEPSSD